MATNVLFIGGLPPPTTDDDLLAVLSPHGALDCATVRVPHGRAYAFALFREASSARAAMASANGVRVLDGSLRTEVARPAKAVRNLWVAGIGSSVTKQDLQKEFSKFGKIEDLTFFRGRNSAMIDFYTLEDAISAHKSMNGKVLKGEQLCVDFQRTPPSKPSQRESRNSKEGTPSSVLWIGYPPNYSKIDEQKLRNAMIRFGEIERIKCFPLRKYAFVEFRTADEARRAKEGLHNRLFNDPKIRILFSHSGSLRSDPLREDEWRGDSDGILPAPRGREFEFEERERKRFRRESEDYYERRERSFSPGFYRGYSPDLEGMRWRGAVLKGGSFVCNARCVPIGRGVDLPLLPEAINCSARTDLETLARHYHDSSGFDAVYFLPDSEADFASYTEFLQYLCLKNRAGVAKLSDGSTTLFLVPPSDFLTDVLGIRGPERLYGIVLRLPEPDSPAFPRPGSVDHGPGSVHQTRPVFGRPGSVDHGPGSVHQTRPVFGRPGSVDREGGVSVSLPPELISSLASIIPAISGAGASTSNVSFSGSNTGFVQGQVAQFPTNGGPPGGYVPQGSSQFPTNGGPPGGYEPRSSSRFPTSGGPPVGYEPHSYPTNRGPPGGYEPQSSSYMMNKNSYQYDPAAPSQSYGTNYMNTSYEPVPYQNTYESANNAAYQPNNTAYQPSMGPAVGTGTGTGFSDQQDVDKNQRYQSTLQFAANLLLQIQQKQQQQQQQ
ncbi:hypothetical protein LUZ60_015883 [Juncus effusus]|nr:hypothetical protein LUZ60_015883 [Juncus effusus]